ncbi:MAG: FAD-binding oxidoreductase [Actinomycetota bacterium]|nr:FAD-binding oxidoreductase [Actinomycetota bacterium]
MSNPQSVPYWLATAPDPDYTGRELSTDADFVVIGGGFNGLSAALHLAKRGASVVLLESGKIGSGASGTNGGMVGSGMSLGFGTVLERYGDELGREFYMEFMTAIDMVENLIAEEDIDCDFARNGKIKVAAKPGHYDNLITFQELLRTQVGVETVLIPKDQLREEVGTDQFFGGLVEPRSAEVHVGKLCKGIGIAADRAGVEIHENLRATELKKTGRDAHEHSVMTDRGVVRAKKVLVCTNGYSRGLMSYFTRRIVPIGSFVIATEPLAPEICDLVMPTRRSASTSKNLIYYWRLTPDNRMIFGGRARFAVAGPKSDAKSAKILRSGMTWIFPELADARIDYQWGGMTGFTMSKIPHAGEQDGVFFSLGHNGHGVQMAVYMGKIMADVMNGKPEANPWRGQSFQAIPGHYGPPWFLPVVGGYFRIKDMVK